MARKQADTAGQDSAATQAGQVSHQGPADTAALQDSVVTDQGPAAANDASDRQDEKPADSPEPEPPHPASAGRAADEAAQDREETAERLADTGALDAMTVERDELKAELENMGALREENERLKGELATANADRDAARAELAKRDEAAAESDADGGGISDAMADAGVRVLRDRQAVLTERAFVGEVYTAMRGAREG